MQYYSGYIECGDASHTFYVYTDDVGCIEFGERYLKIQYTKVDRWQIPAGTFVNVLVKGTPVTLKKIEQL